MLNYEDSCLKDGRGCAIPLSIVKCGDKCGNTDWVLRNPNEPKCLHI